MSKNIKFQYLSAIDDNFKQGQDKHSIKAAGQMNGTRVFSFGDREGLKDVSANFSNWMKDNHPDIRMVKEVKLEHIQEFINEKAESCSMETLSQYVSRFNKLEKLVNQKFGIKVKYKGVVIPAAKENTKIRDKSMKVEHYQKLKSELSESKTIGKVGLELSAKLGLRASEIAKLQGRDINLEKGEVHVHNGKGARNRNVPIREEDRAYFTNLKARLGERERPCPGKADSVNAAIRRYMKRVDIAKEYRVTTVHAIRKMYAQSEFDRYRAQGHDIKAAIGKVSEQLGHGENRIALMREYVLNIK